ncbi:aminopeptidase P family protein [Polycladomyces sp. WAk]|uniref:Aminopeptidase P family protein n=1 Tax=Polycladomyces zharkentensis TaxID=2807616 RepID=A0ABS2WHX2_9BACL|nr:Xaa-Pro peptidase family protein [Polycladomyces sp. WAk]MBN2909123.1 aminopeptidase P family protein [Polycladomyces sp. WAk]
MDNQLPLVPVEEIERRYRRFQQTLDRMELDGALIAQNIDLYYLTGTMQNGLLFVPRKGEPCLYVKKSVARAKRESSVPVEQMGRMRELPQRMAERFGPVQRVGMELDVLPYAQATFYADKLFPKAELTDISFPLRLQRAVKSDYELNQLKRAAGCVREIVEALPEMLKPGMREVELVAEIERRLRMKGNINLYRMRAFNQELVLGMVASGAAAAAPTYFDGPAGGMGLSTASPQGAGWKEIRVGEPILVDISAVIEGYIIDQTRLAVIGELEDDLEHAYGVARQILKATEEKAKPGVTWESLYMDALKMAEEAGLADHFMGYGEDQAKFLGHGVGLELDELPVLARGFDQPLEEGMVIAVEPKFTFPGRGVIGIENTYVVTADGLKSLTTASEEIVRVRA